MNKAVPSLSRVDVYQSITDKIMRAIEAGAGTFVMPWHCQGPGIGRPTNAATKQPYRGVNVVALWADSMLAGYGSGHWATFNQWNKLGAKVRKGERGSVIVFFRELDPGQNAKADDDDARSVRRLVARASYVFNASQVDGWAAEEVSSVSLVDTIDHVESFVAGTGARIRHGGSTACYLIREDVVRMPDKGRFRGTPTSTPTASYYATLLHELTHWTGAPHRLARTFGTRFGDEAYAAEELVAELGAAFLCADLGLANDPRPDHAAYVADWLKILGSDRKAIFTASREANVAVACLHELAFESGLLG
jgi:antirestriction protein ArdC